MRGFKSAVTKDARAINHAFGWQERFHDHIIRDEEEYQRIAHYIVNNPANWKKDKFYDRWNGTPESGWIRAIRMQGRGNAVESGRYGWIMLL